MLSYIQSIRPQAAQQLFKRGASPWLSLGGRVPK
jgi:hypothetical protein